MESLLEYISKKSSSDYTVLTNLMDVSDFEDALKQKGYSMNFKAKQAFQEHYLSTRCMVKLVKQRSYFVNVSVDELFTIYAYPGTGNHIYQIDFNVNDEFCLVSVLDMDSQVVRQLHPENKPDLKEINVLLEL